jgi:hypothetical protein
MADINIKDSEINLTSLPVVFVDSKMYFLNYKDSINELEDGFAMIVISNYATLARLYYVYNGKWELFSDCVNEVIDLMRSYFKSIKQVAL